MTKEKKLIVRSEESYTSSECLLDATSGFIRFRMVGKTQTMVM